MLRVPQDAIIAGVRVLDEATARYVTRVHRLNTGDVFLAFDPVHALEAEAEIVSTNGPVHVRLSGPVACTNLPRRRVTVIQTASKGSKIEDVLRDATELGVTRFVVAVGQRSIKRPEASQTSRWVRVSIEAARQCGRGDLPELAGPMPLAQALAEPGDVRWLMEPRGVHVRVAAASATKGATVLVIGPEGGFAPEELELAERLGYLRVSLGSFVLRTETACAAALGAIAALTDAG